VTDEILRIQKVYQDRDTVMPLNDWMNNIYHPRNPLGHLLQRHNHMILVKAINSLKIDLASLHILDVGCGYGYWLRYLVELGAVPCNLTGIDLSEQRISAALEKNSDIHWIHSTSEKLPFPANHFNIVLQSVVFSSILDNDTRRILAEEMLRVLKPDGYIFWIDHKINMQNLAGFTISQVRKYFHNEPLIYIESVHPRYNRKLYGHFSWLAEALYQFTKIVCDSWFLIIQKKGHEVTNHDC